MKKTERWILKAAILAALIYAMIRMWHWKIGLTYFTELSNLFADLMKRRGVKVREVILEQDGWFRWIFIAVSVCFVLLFGKYGKRLDSAAFIYFQF